VGKLDINKKLSVIREEIVEEAREEKRRIIQDQEKVLQEKHEKFQQELEEEKEKMLDSYRQKSRAKKEEIISKVNLRSAKTKKRKFNDFLKELLSELLIRLKQYRYDDNYYIFLKDLIKEGVRTLGTKQVDIKLNKDDFDIYQKLIEEELKKEMPKYDFELQSEVADIEGGVIVKTRDEREIVENTFQVCIERIKGSMAREIQSLVLGRR
jgi:vacuolar-type H+-ATPase subunit E/Vma4